MPRPDLKNNKRDEPPLGKRERALRALAGQEVDRRPFTFWHPFGLAHMKSESLTAAALTFAATYAVDLLRMPTVRDLPLPPQTSLDRPHDLTAIEPMSPRQGYWGDRLESLKSIVRLAEGRIAVFEAIPDPLTALGWACPPDVLQATERGNRSFLEKALGTVADSYRGYIKLLLTEARVDGIVIEIGSASFESREPEDFESLVKPHLVSLIAEVRSHGDAPVWLQVAGKRIYVEPLFDLGHNLLSWSHLGHGPSLEKLPKRQRGAIGGGINELALEKLSYQDIRRHVDEARNQTVALLCPGDALPADMSPTRLVALSNFLMKRDRMPEPDAVGGRPPIIDEP